MKKALCFLMTFILIFTFFTVFSAFAVGSGLSDLNDAGLVSEIPEERILPRLVDEAELLSESDEKKLLKKLDKTSEDNAFDVAIVTVEGLPYSYDDVESYADDIYDYYGFGQGESRDGCLLLINMAGRDWYITTCGNAEYAFGDDDIQYIGEEMIACGLSDGDYYNAFSAYARLCEEIYSVSFSDNVDEGKYTSDDPNSPLAGVNKAGSVSEIPDRRMLPRLVDEAELLTPNEKNKLLSFLDEKSEMTVFDIAVVTVDVLPYNYYSVEAYADDIYDYYGFGQGESRDGCLLLINMSERDWYITTCGYGITALTSAGIQYIGEKMISSGLSDGDYYSAFVSFADNCERFVCKARDGEPYNERNLPKNIDWLMWISISVIIGIIAALIVVLIMVGKLKSVKNAVSAGNYIVPGSFRLTRSFERLLYTNVTSVRRVSDDSTSGSGGGSGGGIHISSSGTSHGGGGGKF